MAMRLLRLRGLLCIYASIILTVQVRGDADTEMDKRHVSVLARTGQLPVQGKRYVAALAKNGELSSFMRPAWNKKLQRYMEENGPETASAIDEALNAEKRYVGALAKTGDLRFSRYRDEKRDEVDSLIDELLTAEELRKLRKEALREELLREQEEQNEEEAEATFEDKRSLASLARSGNIPFSEGKRGIANLAKNGDFPWSGKRGGIASLMRSRFNQFKRTHDLDNEELENFIDDLTEDEGFQNPDKRNLASFAKSGGLSGLSYRNEKKDVFGDWAGEEDKRSIQSLARNRMSPLVEGKRYLGAFFASNGRPPYMSRDPNFKRNIGSMARTWGYSGKMGKRDYEEDGFDPDEYYGVDDVAKRYVAALLRQGRLPVGTDTMPGQVSQDDDRNEKEEANGEVEEEKRHIGSLAAHSSFAMRKKKSVDLKEQDDETKKAEETTRASTSGDDNKTVNDIVDYKTHRAKRQAYFDASPSSGSSDEYPMPVMQNTVTSDYEDIVSKASGDGPSARNKRYFAVRGGGKIPGGRLPQIGSSRRSHNQNSGRRRGGH